MSRSYKPYAAQHAGRTTASTALLGKPKISPASVYQPVRRDTTQTPLRILNM